MVERAPRVTELSVLVPAQRYCVMLETLQFFHLKMKKTEKEHSNAHYYDSIIQE